MAAFIKCIVFTALAVVLACLSLSIPVHIRSIDGAAVEYAGAQGPSNLAKIEEALNAAYVGPAQRIAEATQAQAENNGQFKRRSSELLEKSPIYRISGGPDRAFQDFLKLVQSDNSGSVANPSVISLLLPRTERAALGTLLADSDNANVAALLTIRNLQILNRLHPANHPAGAPYDSGILTLALLIEGGHFSPALSQKIGTLAEQANLGITTSATQIEDCVIATLSLGRQLEYRSLVSLAQLTESLKDWQQIGTLFRADSKRINTIFTSLLYTNSPSAVFEYFALHPESYRRDIDRALQSGPEAMQLLIDSQQAIHQPAPLAEQILPVLEPFRPISFVQLSAMDRDSALLFKAILLFLAGLALSSSLGVLWRASQYQRNPVSHSNPAVVARNILMSFVIMLTVWACFEPELLKATKNLPDNAAPRLEFAVASTLDSLKSPVKAMQELNQVTLLVLALFFIIQLVIYCFCLIKLREIAKENISATMKLRLLENEENLFDFGLYVGLGGTVLSLILVAIGIVEASLMAAYASTLFGILFTAMLKVMNLRGYRRQLILQAGHDSTNPNLMSDLNL